EIWSTDVRHHPLHLGDPMNVASPWVRALQVLALLLGVAVIVLFFAWLRINPVAPPAATEDLQQRVFDSDPSAATGVGVQQSIEGGVLEQPVMPREASAVSDKATLFGVVRSADGTLVADGYLWLHNGSHLVETESLRESTFAYAGLAPGHYRLSSRIPDELPFDREVEVLAPHTRLDIKLPERWLLTVQAVTNEGKPLGEALSPMGLDRSFRALGFATEQNGDLPPSADAEFAAGLGPFRGKDAFRDRGQLALPKQTVGILTLPPDGPVHVALMLGS